MLRFKIAIMVFITAINTNFCTGVSKKNLFLIWASGLLIGIKYGYFTTFSLKGYSVMMHLSFLLLLGIPADVWRDADHSLDSYKAAGHLRIFHRSSASKVKAVRSAGTDRAGSGFRRDELEQAGDENKNESNLDKFFHDVLLYII